LVVHFDVRFDPRYQTITTGNIVDILSRELSPETSRYLANLTIEAKSLEVQESLKALNAQVSLQSTVSTSPPTTTAPPPRRCSKLDLSYCKHLPYNVSSYPNILGHRSLLDVEEDVIAFRYAPHIATNTCSVPHPIPPSYSRTDDDPIIGSRCTLNSVK